MRAILYTVIGLLFGIIVGVFAIGILVPYASKPILLVVWGLISIIFGSLAFLLARKVDRFDTSPIADLRLNFIILGASSLLVLGLAVGGVMQLTMRPSLIILGLLYIALYAIGYIYYGLKIHRHLTPSRIIYVKIFLVSQLVISLAFAIFFGESRWLSMIIQAVILFYLYKKLQESGETVNAITSQPTSVDAKS